MSDLFLGLIALAVLVMAAIQVAVVIIAMRLARRLDRLADRLEQDIRPIIASLQSLTTDAARVTAAFRAILAIFRGQRKESRPAGDEEDDPLFIG
ncbi:MAG: hypothetical protein HY824_01465 [Acidobacteria bacterium]|nr:hypothetical protein [Acidobacteriota bacterium]